MKAKIRRVLYGQSQIAPKVPYHTSYMRRYRAPDREAARLAKAEKEAKAQAAREEKARLKLEAERLELTKREEEARADEIAFQKRLAAAKPDGSRCIQKACPFPAVLDGECRAHAHDRHAQTSLLPSIHNFLMEHALGSMSRIRLPVYENEAL